MLNDLVQFEVSFAERMVLSQLKNLMKYKCCADSVHKSAETSLILCKVLALKLFPASVHFADVQIEFIKYFQPWEKNQCPT